MDPPGNAGTNLVVNPDFAIALFPKQLTDIHLQETCFLESKL